MNSKYIDFIPIVLNFEYIEQLCLFPQVQYIRSRLYFEVWKISIWWTHWMATIFLVFLSSFQYLSNSRRERLFHSFMNIKQDESTAHEILCWSCERSRWKGGEWWPNFIFVSTGLYLTMESYTLLYTIITSFFSYSLCWAISSRSVQMCV